MIHPGTFFLTFGFFFAFFQATPAFAHLVNTNIGEFYAGMIHPLTGTDHLLLTLCLALIASQCEKRTARIVVFLFPLVLLGGTAAGSRLHAFGFLIPSSFVLLMLLGGMLTQARRMGSATVGALSVMTGSIIGYRSGMDMAASQVNAQFIPGVALNGFILVALIAAWIPKAESPAGRTLRFLIGAAFVVAGIIMLFGFIEPSGRGVRLPSQEDLLGMLKVKELSVPIVAGILAGAFTWGAAHALTPGHGKAIVAAYLIGSRSTPWHAIYLGLTVTFTHTLGVFILGLIALFASRHILPEQLYPWLAMISGLIVVVLGAGMLANRLRLMFSPGEHLLLHTHNHHHNHTGDHFHLHDVDHHHLHHHDDHQHHDDGGIAVHNHEHDQDRSHHGHGHSHLPPGADGTPVTWKSLLGLGISGGLLPCPSAVILLLAAISFNWTALGIVLVLFFSLGLACVLSAVGLLFVKGGRLIAGIPQFAPALRFLSVASAFVILSFGVWITCDAITRISQ